MLRQRCPCAECKPLFREQDAPGPLMKSVVVLFMTVLPVTVFLGHVAWLIFQKMNGG